MAVKPKTPDEDPKVVPTTPVPVTEPALDAEAIKAEIKDEVKEEAKREVATEVRQDIIKQLGGNGV